MKACLDPCVREGGTRKLETLVVLADGLLCAYSQFGGVHIVYMGHEHDPPTPCSAMLLEGLCYVSQGTVFSAAFRGSQGLPFLCHF